MSSPEEMRQIERLDKSVLGGSMFVVATQRFTDADAMRAASRAPHLPPIFKGLDASLPPERTANARILSFSESDARVRSSLTG
jgi:hypothetical protein